MKNTEIEKTLGLLESIQRLAKRLNTGNVAHDGSAIALYAGWAIKNLEKFNNGVVDEKNK